MNPMSVTDEFIDTAIARLKTILNRSFFEKSEVFFVTLAHFSAAAAALLIFAAMCVLSVRAQSFAQAGAGLIWAGAIVACHYVGRKFLPLCADFVARNRINIASPEVPKLFGAVTGVLFLYSTAFGLLALLDTTTPYDGWSFVAVVNVILGALGDILPGAACLLYLTAIFWNPDLASTGAGEPPDQGALSILGLLYKTAVRLAPVIFGVFTAAGALQILGTLLTLASGRYPVQVFDVKPVALGLLYPFAIYILAQFLYLFVDCCKAVLSLKK